MLIWWSSVWQRGLSFSKGYSLNVFHLKQISICFHFLFNFEIRKLQVKFNSSQTPLSWPTSNMTRIVVVSVLYLLFWKLQMILPLKIYYRHTFIPRYQIQYFFSIWKCENRKWSSIQVRHFYHGLPAIWPE